MKESALVTPFDKVSLKRDSNTGMPLLDIGVQKVNF